MKLSQPIAVSRSFVLIICCLLCLNCSGEREEEKQRSPGAPGVTDSEILIGSSSALTGHASFLGTQTVHGALAYLDHVNEQGGIHGRKIRVIAYDDAYDPPRCVANTQKLINDDKVFALFCYVGTPTAVKVIPLVEEGEIPLVGLFTGADALRKPHRRYIINIRASYYQETAAMVRYLVEDLDIRNIAVFYQYDAYGFDGLTGTEIALKKYDMVPVSTATYVRGTMDVEHALEDVMASNAQAVIMIGTYDPCAKFIKLARSSGFDPMFLNVSFVGADELARRLGKAGEGVIITQVVPPPTERLLLPTADEYVRLLGKYFPEDTPNFVGFEGFLNARILVEGLRRAGRNLDREGFIDAVESIKSFSMGIADSVTFGPDDHQGLESVYFTKIQDGRLFLITRL
jgi:branched-chain amino acid transport system substrate-binding protein